MIHELKKIVQAYEKAAQQGIKTVLATVVALEGSSYRRPGVRMLIHENGVAIGAVSGGCVEKEVIRQSESVFAGSEAKMMTYDGRYRLGCEGILYILIEPFEPSIGFLNAFKECIRLRQGISTITYYSKTVGNDQCYGSIFKFGKDAHSVRNNLVTKVGADTFEQKMPPCFKLLIIGSEHDAVQLGSYASLTGWEVTVVAPPSMEKKRKDFPGIQELLCVEPESFSMDIIDRRTAVILMTHSYVRDLKYLLRIKDTHPAYLGILGPAKRREKLLGELIERYPEVDDSIFDKIHGPAGLNIGAETAQEIAVAIIAEILAVVRKQAPMMLKDKLSGIHS